MSGPDAVRQNEEIDVLTHALGAIASDSTDPEAVRIALIGLYETARGRAYLQANPIQI